MTFTDDDLKRFKQASKDGIYPYSEPSFTALLARLEAAEKSLEIAREWIEDIKSFNESYEVWHKVAGK